MSCAIFLTCSCGGEKPADDSGDVLLSMGSKILTLHEVEDKIPVGIDPADSVALFREIIGNWVTTAVISEFAESKLPDMEEIDRRVEDYRNRLIVTEYLRRMKESRQPKISLDSIREYYDIHRNELLTESPLVKGIYIKVPSSIKGIDEIRQLVFSGTEEDIDRLEMIGWRLRSSMIISAINGSTGRCLPTRFHIVSIHRIHSLNPHAISRPLTMAQPIYSISANISLPEACSPTSLPPQPLPRCLNNRRSAPTRRRWCRRS